MLNILLITSRSDFGGGPRHVHQLVENLSNDVCISMAFPKDGEPYGNLWQKDARIREIFYLPHRKLSIKKIFALRKFAKKNNIQIAHSHGMGAGIYSRLLKIICPKIKVIHTFHGIIGEHRKRNRIMGLFLKPFTNQFISVSKGEKEIALKENFASEKNIKIIYNGAKPFSYTEDRIKDNFQIVTFSRFDYQKNMERTLDIARKFKDKRYFEFIWVGDGDDFERLKNISEKEDLNIRFAGFSKMPQKYLQTASLYFSTSRFEGLPYALIEACDAGLPIVATNVTGNNEVCINNYNGILFDTNEQALDAIKNIYEDNELQKIYSENSKKLFMENFTEERMVCKIEQLYNEVLNG